MIVRVCLHIRVLIRVPCVYRSTSLYRHDWSDLVSTCELVLERSKSACKVKLKDDEIALSAFIRKKVYSGVDL